jgi:hypothetical protein
MMPPGQGGAKHGESSARGTSILLAVNADLPGGLEHSGQPEGAAGARARSIVLLALALAAVLAFLGWRFFVAEPTPQQWARCLWQEVPESSSNWLAMGSPELNVGAGPPVPAELLKARLLGACAEMLAPVGQPRAQAPAWTDVSAMLAGTRPEVIAQDASDPRAFVCEVYFANDPGLGRVAAYDWGFGDFNTGWIIGRRSLYRASDHYGQKLTAANSVRFCRLIGPDGRPGRDRFQRAPLPDTASGAIVP